MKFQACRTEVGGGVPRIMSHGRDNTSIDMNVCSGGSFRVAGFQLARASDRVDD